MLLLLNIINDLCLFKMHFPIIVCEVVQDNVMPQLLAFNSHLQTSCFGRMNGLFNCLINISIIAQSFMCLLSAN